MDITYIFTICQSRTKLLYLMLSHAVHEQISTAVNENGRSYGIVPVVVMGETPQRCFKSADRYGDVAEVFTYLLTVDYHRTVGTFSRLSACCIRIIRALSLSGSVVCDH